MKASKQTEYLFLLKTKTYFLYRKKHTHKWKLWVTAFAWTSKHMLPNCEGEEDARKWQTHEVREVASIKILSSKRCSMHTCFAQVLIWPENDLQLVLLFPESSPFLWMLRCSFIFSPWITVCQVFLPGLFVGGSRWSVKTEKRSWHLSAQNSHIIRKFLIDVGFYFGYMCQNRFTDVARSIFMFDFNNTKESIYQWDK